MPSTSTATARPARTRTGRSGRSVSTRPLPASAAVARRAGLGRDLGDRATEEPQQAGVVGSLAQQESAEPAAVAAPAVRSHTPSSVNARVEHNVSTSPTAPAPIASRAPGQRGCAGSSRPRRPPARPWPRRARSAPHPPAWWPAASRPGHAGPSHRVTRGVRVGGVRRPHIRSVDGHPVVHRGLDRGVGRSPQRPGHGPASLTCGSIAATSRKRSGEAPAYTCPATSSPIAPHPTSATRTGAVVPGTAFTGVAPSSGAAVTRPGPAAARC